MLKMEIDIINRRLNSDYGCEQVFLDGNALVESATGRRIELADDVFKEIIKAKRLEYLEKLSSY